MGLPGKPWKLLGKRKSGKAPVDLQELNPDSWGWIVPESNILVLKVLLIFEWRLACLFHISVLNLYHFFQFPRELVDINSPL